MQGVAYPNVNTFSPQPLSDEGKQHSLPTYGKGSNIVVVGAGAFGSWAAFYLLQKGFNVIHIDAWGPAHSRSSSGDETRVIRSTYGANEVYFDLNVQALSLWKEHEKQFGKQLFFNTGVLWFCYQEKTPLVDDSIPFAKKHQMDYEYLTPGQLRSRYPLINVSDLHHAYFDPFGGYLKARDAIQMVSEAFIKAGGQSIQAHVLPGEIKNGNLTQIKLSNGSRIQADAYIFACGSWLGKLFPEILSQVITCTKQEVYYFGVPSQHSMAFENLPVWVDVDGNDFYYGIPGNAHRGFKLGVDIRGIAFDPTSDDHVPTPATLTKAREFITHRFPDLKNAPLVENRVCPYENSPDGNFIFDLLPETGNAFILGGGSGHGFKHGPALGKLVSNVLAGERETPRLFQLAEA